MPNKKTILVTGGAGFIGSSLIKELSKDETNNIISLDNYFAGSESTHIAGVKYINGHTKDISKLITETPDMIYHLGEYSRVAKALEEPSVVWDLNIDGTLAVLEFWRTHKCKLLYAGSSTKLVGARADGVLGRDLSPYTWAKAVNSELVINYTRWYDLPSVIVYFYNVYGPGERTVHNYGTVIETFKQKHLASEPLQVRLPGTQTRAFTHVDDTVSGIILAGEKGSGDSYGISAQECYSLLEVAEMFGGQKEMLPQTKTTRESTSVDTQKIQSLGWTQKNNLKDYVSNIKQK